MTGSVGTLLGNPPAHLRDCDPTCLDMLHRSWGGQTPHPDVTPVLGGSDPPTQTCKDFDRYNRYIFLLIVMISNMTSARHEFSCILGIFFGSILGVFFGHTRR